MNNHRNVRHQQELLAIYRRNLEGAMRRAAQYGGEHKAPTEVASDIYDARTNIKHVKSLLRGWGVDVADLPNEVEPPPIEQDNGASVSHGLTSPQASGQSHDWVWWITVIGLPVIAVMIGLGAWLWPDPLGLDAPGSRTTTVPVTTAGPSAPTRASTAFIPSQTLATLVVAPTATPSRTPAPPSSTPTLVPSTPKQALATPSPYLVP